MKNTATAEVVGLPALSDTGTEPMKRLNANLPDAQIRRFKNLASKHGVTMTTLIRDGLGLLEYALDAIEKGNRIVVVNSGNKVEQEILLPSYGSGPR